jgi:hypothetical protein
MTKSNGNPRLQDLIAESEAVEAAVQHAVEEALRAHKRAGNAVVGWHNDQLKWVPAEEIPVDDTGTT